MQLAHFMVILTFTHLSSEEQSEYIPDVHEQLNYLPRDCRENLINQAEEKCMQSFSHKLIEIKGCTIKCGSVDKNAGMKLTSSQTFRLKDGTPCGHRKVCIMGQCIDTCRMTFV
uniref:Putative conserved secreted protein n=1 Tax=Ixodes ricinus TaxID=34613 RepID=A0A6B0UKJ9_IXORI